MFTFKKLGQYGRLGNQLFQIASTIGIANRNNAEFCFPDWAYSDYFTNKLPTCRIEHAMVYKEDTPYYRDMDLNGGKHWSLEGYFQSWKYFADCEETVRYFLDFPSELSSRVAVHVRRGDYMKLQHVHPVLSLDYYKQAFKIFKGRKFTVFSDDIDWCVDNLDSANIKFVPTGPDIRDFKLMSEHSDFIIANSSFSWWAAWLSKNKDKTVVAPSTYVAGESQDDRIPPEWIKI